MSVELDDLLAFNEETASLIRVGVPVSLGLETMDPDPYAAIGRINAQLVDRVSSGTSLAEAVDELSPQWPPVYASVVKSGLSCEDLSVALESVQRNAASYASFTRQAAVSILYPMIVVTVALLLFIFYCLFMAPAFVEFWRGMELPRVGVVGYLETAAAKWPIVAVGCVILVAAFWWSWFRTQRRDRRNSWTTTWLDRLPMMRSVAYDYGCAQLADIVAELTRYELPLADALQLAAGAIENDELREGVLRQAAGGEPERRTERTCCAVYRPSCSGCSIKVPSCPASLTC